jgi:hypothetical protein
VNIIQIAKRKEQEPTDRIASNSKVPVQQGKQLPESKVNPQNGRNFVSYYSNKD